MNKLIKNTIFILILTVISLSFPFGNKASAQLFQNTGNLFDTNNNSQGVSPSVITNNASGITQSEAVLNGYVNLNGGVSVTTWFEYGTSANGLNQNTVTILRYSSGTTSANLFGLNSGSTYYFRLCAVNSIGQTCDTTIKSFTTYGGQNNNNNNNNTNYLPTVSTTSVSVVTTNSATLNLNFSSPNSNPSVRFAYGKDVNNLNYLTNYVSQNSYSGSFGQTISNLESNTIYYFRAEITNNSGQAQGQILSFKTNQIQNNPSPVSGVVATTTLANNIGNSVARLNGYASNISSESLIWFEYGKTIDLGLSSISITKSSDGDFGINLINLSSDTIYYFRAVAQSNGVTSKGEIKIFKTLPVSVVVADPVNPNPTPTLDPVVTDNSKVSLKIENNSEKVSTSDELEYIVTYKNITGQELTDVVLRITLPKEISLTKFDEGNFSKSENVLTINIGKLNISESGKVAFTAKVLSSVSDKETLITSANLIYTDSKTKVQEEFTAYVLNDLKTKNLQAAAVGLTGFNIIPTTLLGWLITILIIFCLVFFGRKFYANIKTK